VVIADKPEEKEEDIKQPIINKKKDDEDGSLASDEEYEYVIEEVEEKDQPSSKDEPKEENLKNVDDWDPTQNPYYEEKAQCRSWRKEGFGSAPPPKDDKNGRNRIGQLFRRIRDKCVSEDDLRAMKVATEDTKDKLTLGEQLTKAALIVLAPEIYLDVEDGDENKGVYRSIANQELMENTSRPKDPTILLMDDNKRLRSTVKKMEKTIKSLEMQTDSWKVRCKELEAELRRYKGQDSDDSSAEVILEDSDSSEEDDGIEWTENNTAQEGNLLDIPSQDENLENLIDLTQNESLSNNKQKVENLIDFSTTNEELLMDISTDHENATSSYEQAVENLIDIPSNQEHNNNNSQKEDQQENLLDMLAENDEKLSFDPLANGSSQERSNSLGETEKDKSQIVIDPILEAINAGISSEVNIEDEKVQIALDSGQDDSGETTQESADPPQNSDVL